MPYNILTNVRFGTNLNDLMQVRNPNSLVIPTIDTTDDPDNQVLLVYGSGGNDIISYDVTWGDRPEERSFLYGDNSLASGVRVVGNDVLNFGANTYAQGGPGADVFWGHGGHWWTYSWVRDFKPLTEKDRIVAEGEIDTFRFTFSEDQRDNRDGTGRTFEIDSFEFINESNSPAVDGQWFKVTMRDDNRVEYGGQGEDETRKEAAIDFVDNFIM
jgi:hypothetical protein